VGRACSGSDRGLRVTPANHEQPWPGASYVQGRLQASALRPAPPGETSTPRQHLVLTQHLPQLATMVPAHSAQVGQVTRPGHPAAGPRP
jgi:hypothetical protein